ncbi:MAG TPA: hypothetical protein VHU87_05030 [Rhizomicrobium sp.]|jgi:hypothetical protein|nr:hypothetical protein [Rhizomicrobium sp.]
MVAYRKMDEASPPTGRRVALSHELFHGLTPDEFRAESEMFSEAVGMSPGVRRRLEAQLKERLMTPPDAPSWGPDWVKHGEKFAPKRGEARRGVLSGLFGKQEEEAEAEEDDAAPTSEDYVIARNMEKSRQIAHYKWLYAGAIGLALIIALAAMFVDYEIIRGDIWTRALSNEFMVVPAALQSTVIFKSLQVIFAVLIIHFMLKITGVYGRNTLVTAAFLFALVMIGCLGYLVAYNNMSGGTSTTLEHQQTTTDMPQNNSIDKLLNTADTTEQAPAATPAAMEPASDKKSYSLFGLPQLSQSSLANTDSWFWLAFASVIFFIVSTVAALYLQGAENNIRNVSLARDYKHRQRQFAQLHLLQQADRQQS